MVSNQARVGLFTLAGLLALIFVFYVISDLGSRRGYQIGVHFSNVVGLKQGGYVMQQGVIIGTVADVTLLPDYTVEVVLNIRRSVDIPSNAEFLIQSPITGDPYLTIKLPKRAEGGPVPSPMEHTVLPLAQQPQGKIPVTIADLLATGQNEATRVDAMLADIERREPEIMTSLQESARNVDTLTRQTTATVGSLSARSDQMSAQLQQSLSIISDNLVALSGSLRQTVDAKSGQVSKIVDNLETISKSLAKTADNVQQLAGDPAIHQNVVDTTTQLKNTAASIADIAADLHHLTGNPQTQAQLHDTVANIDAASQRVNSILERFGGHSSVYGVDAGATPAPTGSGSPPALSNPPQPSQGATHGRPMAPAGGVTDLFAVQLRISELAKSERTTFSTPLLSRDRGPQSDFDVWIRPHAATSAELGANDIGGYATVNAAIFKRLSPTLRLGGGVLYSRLGVAGSVDARALGLDALLYDLRHPTLDVYGRLRVTKGISGFAGERDLMNQDRRPVFGLELDW
ncbi:MCE family protein [bacterium]|nr:MAG: MCE family protein [bacterium]